MTQIRLETDGGSPGDGSWRRTETDRDGQRQTETAAADLRGSDSCSRHQRQVVAVGGSDQTRDRAMAVGDGPRQLHQTPEAGGC